MQPDIAPAYYVNRFEQIFFEEMFIGQKYIQKFARMWHVKYNKN